MVLEPETGLGEDELTDCECQVEVSWCDVHSVGWDGAAGLELQVSQRENTLPTTESSHQPTCPNPLSRPSGLVLNECAFWEHKKQIQLPLVGIFLIFWKAMSLYNESLFTDLLRPPWPEEVGKQKASSFLHPQ